MSKIQEEINDINNLIERVENPPLRRKFKNFFDFSNVVDKIEGSALDGAVYTRNNIPPSAISIEKTFN